MQDIISMNNIVQYAFSDIHDIAHNIAMNKHRLLYLAWASASWKSYIGEELVKHLTESGKKVLLISSDNYYSNDSNLKYLLYGTFDHPNLIDYSLLQKDIEQYFQYGKFSLPYYSFTEKRRTHLTEITESYDIVIVEWLYVIDQLSWTIPTDKWDIVPYKVFVEASLEEIIMRRLVRDQMRVKEPLHVIVGVMSNVFPMRTIFWTVQKEKSDCIIVNDYRILDKEWKISERFPIASDELPHTDIYKTYYMKDYIYNDTNEDNGKIIISEVYLEQWWLLDHVILHKRNNDPRTDHSKYESISMDFYQPSISTELHTLLQLAWLVYEWTYDKIVKYYTTDTPEQYHVVKEKFVLLYKLVS